MFFLAYANPVTLKVISRVPSSIHSFATLPELNVHTCAITSWITSYMTINLKASRLLKSTDLTCTVHPPTLYHLCHTTWTNTLDFAHSFLVYIKIFKISHFEVFNVTILLPFHHSDSTQLPLLMD